MASFASRIGVDDMVLLSDLSNPGINANLKKRYEKDYIYTYIGNVLISLNPYKTIKDLSTERALSDYQGKSKLEMPPHVFAVGDGESGAGKTEASKLIMQYIAHNCGNSKDVIHVRDAILNSNPLLEAFGNSKTIRNNNSSRFGKYMEIQFNPGGEPCGGRVSNYLLEKSRVVSQTLDERSFHVFYHMLAGLDKSQKEQMRLVDASSYFYLTQGKCLEVDGMNDADEWHEVIRAMNVIGFQPNIIQEIIRILSAILWLGNLQFTEADEKSSVSNNDCLELVAWLLQIQPESCSRAICFREIQTGAASKGARGSNYSVPQKAVEALYSRDALAKTLYSRLFDYIIKVINDSLGWKSTKCNVIGILDIYGFEVFKDNGFEQLCINYVNEKLQQIFINLTLKQEQEEYEKEGIKWEPIKFFNNKICCDLIENKQNPIGIFTLLDDTCNFAQATDLKFVTKLVEHHQSHAHFQKGAAELGFIIKHYAGDVEYNANGMCDKNNDTLYNNLISLIQSSSMSLLPTLFTESATLEDKRRPTTACFKLRASCHQLIATLSECHPHYIRCIKPNDKKAANCFTDDRALHQVKYLGLLENIRVRRAGYAYRQFYNKFYYRYAICSEETWPVEKFNNRFKEGCEAVLRSLGLQSKDGKQPYECGSTKLFIRAPETVFALEELLESKTSSYATRIQRFLAKNSLAHYNYLIQKNVNDKLRGRKDRRKNSIERSFLSDYISLQNNLYLIKIIGKGSRPQFADVCNHMEAGKKKRRVVIVTMNHIHIIEIVANKDKITKKTKPWIYAEVVQIGISQITDVVLSCFADNFIGINSRDVMILLENGKKTEILAMLIKLRPDISIRFENNISVKGGKSEVQYKFVQEPSKILPDGGKYSSKKVVVSKGLGQDTYPNLVEPRN